MTDEKINLQTTKGWAIQPMGNGLTAIVFKMHNDSVIGVAMGDQDFGRYATRILQDAQNFAAKQAVAPKESEALVADPILLSSVGVARGRTNSEALLALNLGNIALTFAIELSTLTGMCKNLQKITTTTPPTKSN